jgi:glycosyltransferase involved in cell wall biosynthesis
MSQAMLDEVRRELGAALPASVEIAALGVDTGLFRRPTAYEPWQPGETCRIYSCGRLNPVKGHVYLIEALLELRRRGVPAILEIAGEDEQGGRGYRREFEQFIAERAAGDFVRLLGAVSEGQSRECMARAHVFALASLDEGVSVAVMEAMSMELPTVCTRVGGMHELVDSGVDALLVPAREPGALADALFGLLQEPERALRLGKQARLKVVSRFDHRIGAQVLVRRLSEAGIAAPAP